MENENIVSSIEKLMQDVKNKIDQLKIAIDQRKNK